MVSAKNWVIEAHGKSVWDEVLRQLPDDARRAWESPLAYGWYPVEHVGALLDVLKSTLRLTDRKAIDLTYRRLGRYIADDNLSNIYRLLLSFMSPEKLPKKLPQMWTTYYRGVQVEVEYVPGTKKAACTVHNLPVPDLAPVACGWLEFAFDRVGAKGNRCIEVGWHKGGAGSTPARYEVSW
jgi:hypothetical protein